ncbi:MAG: RbsD/FucU family protein [Acidimicrobiales bacterium]
MLKNVPPLLTPDLVFVLASMGHGDDLAVVDANFPAHSVARRTCHGRVVALAGSSMPEAVRAVLALLPLDDFVETPVQTMSSGGGAGELNRVQQEAQAVVDEAVGRACPMGLLERFAFYEATKDCYAVVTTGERRYYGNVILKKGAIPPG